MPEILKASPIDYGDIQTVRFCCCGCPIEVKSGTGEAFPFLLGSPGHMMAACPFCYNGEEFPAVTVGKPVLGSMMAAKTAARVLAAGLRAEGIVGAGGTWEKEATP